MPKKYTACEMLEKLVSFNTVSSNSNLELIDFVKNYLKELGIESHLVHDETGRKANLYAQVGPNIENGVILSGHTDVVPVEGQSWDTDPFVVTEKDGKLYGRGTCDMKGFLAISLALVPEMLEAGLKHPVQLALSYDEELGCIGAPYMISDMVKKLPRAKAVVVGEPSMMQVVNGHKSIAGFNTTVHGYEIHSSLIHQGVSAVMTAARLIDWHSKQMAINAAKPVGDPIIAGYVPPYTTLHCGVVHGGTASNISAKKCQFTTDIRAIPGEDIQEWVNNYIAFTKEVEAEIQQIHPDARIDVTEIITVPGCRYEENGIAEQLARGATGDNAEHVVAYATEAGQFQDEGYSTIICGPGNIAQAHQPNEYLAISQLEAGTAFVRKIINHLS